MNCNFCLFLEAGLLAILAYDDISRYKSATQSHTGADIDQYAASNAVDGNIATCIRTKEIGTSSPDKTVWWKVDFGGVFNIYSINILFKKYDKSLENRQIGRFAGFSLYVSNTGAIHGATLCYTDGPQLPSLNLTTICTKSGRYVIFYNERLDRVSYPNGYEVTNVITELCEVTVQGCNNVSVYGSNCDTSCPTNCKDNTCHIQSGVCFSCKPGWTDMHCYTKCKEGWYGDNCTTKCKGHCKDGSTCNHVTGHCDGGCDAGWTGSTCDKGCDDGTYGYDCVNKCSGHCLNNSPCNKQTGHCDRGCKPGYTNGGCDKLCSPSHYGVDCNEHCSGHCINNEPCDHASGVCSRGCINGFDGPYCNSSCSKGYFGTNCSRVCSPNCRRNTCRHTDGSCTSCAAGWTGYNCTTECMLSFGEDCQYQCNENCINQTCDRFNGSCLYGCKEGAKCSTDNVKPISSVSSSNNLPITIGSLMSACILIIIGVVITILVLRQRSSRKMSKTSVHRVCLRSPAAAEESVNSENLSNYQELNFALQENPYQSMSR